VITGSRVRFNKFLSVTRHAWMYKFVSEAHQLRGYSDVTVFLLDDWRDLADYQAIATELLIRKNTRNFTVLEI
jgi:hypothetical protein